MNSFLLSSYWVPTLWIGKSPDNKNICDVVLTTFVDFCKSTKKSCVLFPCNLVGNTKYKATKYKILTYLITVLIPLMLQSLIVLQAFLLNLSTTHLPSGNKKPERPLTSLDEFAYCIVTETKVHEWGRPPPHCELWPWGEAYAPGRMSGAVPLPHRELWPWGEAYDPPRLGCKERDCEVCKLHCVVAANYNIIFSLVPDRSCS